MTHSCSDGFDEGIEWLFQLKGNEEIEKVFQWFQVQCKMRELHEACKTMTRQMNQNPWCVLARMHETCNLTV